MRQGLSIRSEIEGIVSFYSLKLSPARKVLLPNAWIFVYPEDIAADEIFQVEFKDPFLKFRPLKSRPGAWVLVENGFPIEIQDEIAAIYVENSGTVKITPTKIAILGKDGKVAEEYHSEGFELTVTNGQNVKVKEKIAHILSPVEGIIRIELDHDKRATKILVQPGEAYQLPEEFTVKVRDAQPVKEGVLLGFGYIEDTKETE
ncbi:MAG: hypothetical protein PHW04_05040 [Candidatus Wallbacteria bacterium]|nr:hypothetical protein [Candidatus Wallbacteria bacterium]